MNSANALSIIWTDISTDPSPNQGRAVMYSVTQCQGIRQIKLSNLQFPSKFSDSLLTTYRIKSKLPCDMLRLAFKTSHALAGASCFMFCPVMTFPKPSTQSKFILSVFQTSLTVGHLIIFDEPIIFLISEDSISFIIYPDSTHSLKSNSDSYYLRFFSK